jgi:hypothetical protein
MCGILNGIFVAGQSEFVVGQLVALAGCKFRHYPLSSSDIRLAVNERSAHCVSWSRRTIAHMPVSHRVRRARLQEAS